jgi:pimeloyl-ACP methyl ester carboxylesterase
VRYPLAQAVRLDLESFARATGEHPDLVRRLVVIGVLDAGRDLDGTLWFSPAQVSAMARIQRLRAGFMLNYAALGLVLDLLDQIETLRAAMRARPAGLRLPAGADGPG